MTRARAPRLALLALLALLSVAALAACGSGSDTRAITDLAPAGRITSMSVPETLEAARDLGCISYGANAGYGFANLVAVAGGLDQFLQPNEGGLIRVLLLAHLEGFAPADLSDGTEHRLDLYYDRGDTVPGDSFLIDPTATPTAPDWGVQYRRSRLDPSGWIETSESVFVLPAPIFSDFMGRLELTASTFTAQLELDERGLAVHRGILTGYVTIPTLNDLLEQADAACKSPRRPQLCDVASDVLEPGQPLSSILPTVLTFMGGYDTRMEDDHPYACDPAAMPTDCNAVSVCIALDLQGVTARGPKHN